MADPLSKTFDVLAHARNIDAVEVLIYALDAPDEAVRTMAAEALLKRNSVRGRVEIIRHWDSLPQEVIARICENSSPMGPAIKQSLQHGDRELRCQALELVRRAECYDQVPALLAILEDDGNELRDLALEVFRDLVHRLYEHLHDDRDAAAAPTILRNLPQIRHFVLTCLDEACQDFENLVHQRDIVESILILGEAEHATVKKVLGNSPPACRKLAAELLDSSRHPGVMQLILDFLSVNYPHAKAFGALRQRTDPEFIAHLLRWFPNRLSQMQQKNLRQVTSLAWLESDDLALDSLAPPLQAALVPFLSATGLPRELKTSIQEWLVRYGSSEGRAAATQVLQALDTQTAQGIIIDGLDSSDAEVQAWATHQLRAHGISEAFELLVDRLDSPLPEVQAAAREELSSFNVHRILAVFDHLEPQVRLRVGELLQKIDPDCISKLQREIAGPIRRNRVRAALAAQALGLQDRVLPALVALLNDNDAYVRRVAAEILGSVAHLDAAHALQNALTDVSQRVREAAARSLQNMQVSL
jgi:hypothetical protein